MTTFIDRIKVELYDLEEKSKLLSVFTATSKFDELDQENKKLLAEQAVAMNNYSNVLRKRLKLLEK